MPHFVFNPSGFNNSFICCFQIVFLIQPTYCDPKYLLFCAKCYEEYNVGETLASENLKFNEGVNMYPNNYGPRSNMISNNVLRLQRNDVSCLVESCGKKMLIILPSVSSSKCNRWAGRISIL